MTVTKAITLGAILAAGCISGCSKKPAPRAPVVETNTPPVVTNAPDTNPPVAPVPSRTTDLGVVQLTNRCETRIELAGGKSCSITPTRVDSQNVQLTMVLESRMPNGKTQGMSVTKVTAKIDQQFEVDFGGLDLTLTPQLAPE